MYLCGHDVQLPEQTLLKMDLSPGKKYSIDGVLYFVNREGELKLSRQGIIPKADPEFIESYVGTQPETTAPPPVKKAEFKLNDFMEKNQAIILIGVAAIGGLFLIQNMVVKK